MDARYREISAVLKLTVPILGSKINYDSRVGLHHRSPDGDVVLLPGWWNQTLEYGAKALGRGQAQVRAIKFDPIVRCDISPEHIRRYTTDDSYIDHEAIERLMVVKLAIPVQLQVDTVRDILDKGGRYVGLAPFKWHRNYGRFEVVDIGMEVTT